MKFAGDPHRLRSAWNGDAGLTRVMHGHLHA